MTSRERVMASLDFRTTDRVPLDLGGMRSTGISAFAYPGLRATLGLPPRAPRLYDTAQMLALPELDVLDALGCDVAHVTLDECTNAFDEPGRWQPYGFNGRLDALVPHPEAFTVLPDGAIEQRRAEGVSRKDAKAAEHAAAIDYLQKQARASLTPGAPELEQLGQQRAAAVERALLTDTGLAPDRVFLAKDGKVTPQDGKVRFELAME